MNRKIIEVLFFKLGTALMYVKKTNKITPAIHFVRKRKTDLLCQPIKERWCKDMQRYKAKIIGNKWCLDKKIKLESIIVAMTTNRKVTFWSLVFCLNNMNNSTDILYFVIYRFVEPPLTSTQQLKYLCSKKRHFQQIPLWKKSPVMVIDGEKEWVKIFKRVWDSPCMNRIGQHKYILFKSSWNRSTIDGTSWEMP